MPDFTLFMQCEDCGLSWPSADLNFVEEDDRYDDAVVCDDCLYVRNELLFAAYDYTYPGSED